MSALQNVENNPIVFSICYTLVGNCRYTLETLPINQEP